MDLRGVDDVAQVVDKFGLSFVLYAVAMHARESGAYTLSRCVMDCACSSVAVPERSQRRDKDELRLTG